MKHAARVRKIEQALRLTDDHVTRVIVGLDPTEGGLRCSACGGVHRDFESAEQAHGGRGVLFITTEIVTARPRVAVGPATHANIEGVDTSPGRV